LPKGFIGHSNYLAKKEVAIAGNATLASIQPIPKNPGIFYKPDRGWMTIVEG
jgi:hypothetical protein